MAFLFAADLPAELLTLKCLIRCVCIREKYLLMSPRKIRLVVAVIKKMKPVEAVEKLRRPVIPEYCFHNAHMYYILLDSLEQRTDLIKKLEAKGVSGVFHYVPLHSSLGGIKFGRTSGNMTVTNDISDRILRLPLFYQITPEDVETVVKALTEFYAIIDNKG